jgi:hypothetical protein
MTVYLRHFLTFEVLAVPLPAENANLVWQIVNDDWRTNGRMIGASLGDRLLWGRRS